METITDTCNKTAILVFSRHAAAEAKKKKFSRCFAKNKGSAIAARLIRHTLQAARASGLPLIPFFSEKQVGASFGERLANAIEAGFKAGFRQLIICGTDSPHINARQFTEVGNRLQHNQLVLGPSADGGVYLIGIQKDAYFRESFLTIKWLSPFVFSQLQDYGRHHHLLLATEQVAADIDSADALLEWHRAHAGSWLGGLVSLLTLTAAKVFFPYYSVPLHFRNFLLSSSLSRPPCC